MKYRLGDICSITKGGIGIMKAVPGPYTMIALGEANKTHIEYHFDAKAAIIPLVSSTGHGHASMKRVKYCEGKFALGNILCAVIPNDESFVLAKYLHIYLHWNREELLVSQMKGMANVSLPMNRIADVMVTIPSIDKQREIIELEKQLVEKEIEADNLFADQLTQLENLNQAILQEAVQGKLVPQDKSDEPASELLKHIKAEKAKSGKKEKPFPSIKAEEIPFEIPESWVWTKIEEIANVFTGNSINETIKSTKYKKIKEGFPYIGTKDVKFDGLGINYQTGVIIPFDELGFRIAKPNSILICIEGGSSGKKHAITDREICFGNKLLASEINKHLIDFCIYYFYQSPYFKNEFKLKSNGLRGGVSINKFKEILIPIPSLSEQKRIVAEIEKQLAKTKQLKEHIIANQQATEQLLKALLHQAFEVEEIEDVATQAIDVKNIRAVKQPTAKIDTIKPNAFNWDALVAEPLELYETHPVNRIQDIDWELAIMVECIENRLGIGYGDVGLQKNVFNASVKQRIFSKKYEFINSNFGTYSYELKEDLSRNPYLTKKNVKGKEVYSVNSKYLKAVLDKMTAPENKDFTQALNTTLAIYEHPFINKETDKIELFNTVLKIALDKKTKDIEHIYQGMKDWSINQANFKTKAEKFSKPDTDKMIKLLVAKGLLNMVIE